MQIVWPTVLAASFRNCHQKCVSKVRQELTYIYFDYPSSFTWFWVLLRVSYSPHINYHPVRCFVLQFFISTVLASVLAT